MKSDFKPEVVVWLKLRMHSEKSPNYAKSSVRRLKSAGHAIRVAESISSDRFSTGSRINALTAHAQTQTLLSYLKQAALDRFRVRLNVVLFLFLSRRTSLRMKFTDTFRLHIGQSTGLFVWQLKARLKHAYY